VELIVELAVQSRSTGIVILGEDGPSRILRCTVA
jgi:hypothetical protein